MNERAAWASASKRGDAIPHVVRDDERHAVDDEPSATREQVVEEQLEDHDVAPTPKRSTSSPDMATPQPPSTATDDGVGVEHDAVEEHSLNSTRRFIGAWGGPPGRGRPSGRGTR